MEHSQLVKTETMLPASQHTALSAVLSASMIFLYIAAREILLLPMLAAHRSCDAKSPATIERHAFVAIHSLVGEMFYLYAAAGHTDTVMYCFKGLGCECRRL